MSVETSPSVALGQRRASTTGEHDEAWWRVGGPKVGPLGPSFWSPLPIPAAPTEVRSSTQDGLAVVLEALWRYLASAWAPEGPLGVHGVAGEHVRGALLSLEAEVRLWTLGERSWPALASSVAGRAVRASGREDLLRGPGEVANVLEETLGELEAESLSILREALLVAKRPAIAFSGGKDSALVVHLARLAVAPARLSVPLVHIDTGHNFPEVLEYRDELTRRLGLDLIVVDMDAAIRRGELPDPGPGQSRNRLQAEALLGAIGEHGIDALICGARRDEEKARAKERLVSRRDRFGSWDPLRQQPEPWGRVELRCRPGEHLRVFPISNWTERDVWQVLWREGVSVPSLYFAHRRSVVEDKGRLVPAGPWLAGSLAERAEERMVRFRTVGDATCTAAVPSQARSIPEILAEIAEDPRSERGSSRLDDATSECSMEERKREGYF
jgi:sulfate adenylyltransferase subunit 2